jgi:hypothetical protein
MRGNLAGRELQQNARGRQDRMVHFGDQASCVCEEENRARADRGNKEGNELRLLIVCIAGLVAGCAIHYREPITSNPRMKVVKIDGKDIMVAPYSDGTWGATDNIGGTIIPRNPAAETPRHRRAIEAVTGCKVTDSTYDIESGNLLAAVDCASSKASVR